MKKIAIAMIRHIGSFGLKINETKTNVMDPNGIGPVRVDKTKIELMPKFRYTDSMISMKDTTSEEIRIRLTTARSITSDLVNIWKDGDTNSSFKKAFLYSLVWCVGQYDSE